MWLSLFIWFWRLQASCSFMKYDFNLILNAFSVIWSVMVDGNLLNSFTPSLKILLIPGVERVYVSFNLLNCLVLYIESWLLKYFSFRCIDFQIHTQLKYFYLWIGFKILYSLIIRLGFSVLLIIFREFTKCISNVFLIFFVKEL